LGASSKASTWASDSVFGKRGVGIGRAIAEAYVAEGATVWATDLDVAKLDGLARAKRRKLDVLSDRQVASFAEKVGPVDILVNAAGYVHHGTVLECDDKAWDFSFDLNVKAHFRMMKAFMPAWLARGNGTIINMASAGRQIKHLAHVDEAIARATAS
jgi:2-keto-3-deoxy-L-fuconate dehydrogenase